MNNLNQIQTLLNRAIALGLSRLDAEVLLSHVLGESRVYLYSWPLKKLSEEDSKQFNSLVKRRLAGEPIAYLTGRKEFWSLMLDVDQNVLIPRPETELLVELALKLFPQDNKPLNILELGCGSGAIAIALASERPHWHIIATDISASALALAKKNAEKLSLFNIEFYLGDWFQALNSLNTLGTVSTSNPLAVSSSLTISENPPFLFDAIISNPPYIAENDPHLSHPELSFEPILALKAQNNGLQALEDIIDQAQIYLVSKAWLLLEHGYDQADAVAAFFKARNYLSIQHFKDLAAVNRVTVGQKP